MSFLDDYSAPDPDPSKTILDNQQSQDEAAKAQLAAALAKRIAEEEDQSGVRSPLRDLFNENGEIGLANAQDEQTSPPPPDTQPLRITVTPRTTPGPTDQPITPGANITQDQPAPVDLTQDVQPVQPSYGTPDLTQAAQPRPDLTRDLGPTIETPSPTRRVMGGVQQCVILDWFCAIHDACWCCGFA
jgi:hypothetical protein